MSDSIIANPKQLLEIAKVCRKAGITHFKLGDLEFTLSELSPKQVKEQQSKPSVFNDNIEGDGWESLSPEDQLFYSSTPGGKSFDPSESA